MSFTTYCCQCRVTKKEFYLYFNTVTIEVTMLDETAKQCAIITLVAYTYGHHIH